MRCRWYFGVGLVLIGFLGSAAAQEGLPKRLVGLDQNQDHQLSQAEFGVKSLKRLEVFERLDLDQDQLLTVHELRTAPAGRALRKLRRWERFQRADLNRDQLLTKAEVKKVSRYWAMRFGHFDLNQDGFVSWHELMQRLRP